MDREDTNMTQQESGETVEELTAQSQAAELTASARAISRQAIGRRRLRSMRRRVP